MAEKQTTNSETYQFGDTDLAAQRLRLLADVFEPSSRAFLKRFAEAAPHEVADLGCGPGYTTRLVAEVLPSASVRGIDSSPHFIELARRTPIARVTYAVADVTDRLPGGPYDLIYGRYLLTHIAEPEAAIGRWSHALAPGGLLAIEENEWIHTDQRAFAEYLSIVVAMLADVGGELHVGARLAQVAAWPQVEKQASELVSIVVADRAAAGMFAPNLATWRNRPFVEQNYSRRQLDRLGAELAALARDDSPRSSITFGRRRLVLARRVA